LRVSVNLLLSTVALSIPVPLGSMNLISNSGNPRRSGVDGITTRFTSSSVSGKTLSRGNCKTAIGFSKSARSIAPRS
jgi:hypothetical protein